MEIHRRRIGDLWVLLSQEGDLESLDPLPVII